MSHLPRLAATLLLLTVCAVHATAGTPPGPRVRFDFEDGTLQGWVVTEGQFAKLVCDARDVRDHQGKLLLTTLQHEQEARKSDAMVGVLESPVFVLRQPRMTFRIGGGKHRTTRVALCALSGKEHLVASGASSVVMRQVEWRAPKLVGRKVFLRVVDKQTGGWGHVTFDDFEAVGEIDTTATAARQKSMGDRARRQAADALHEANRSLRAAIEDLTASLGDAYPNGPKYLRDLDAIEQRFQDADAKSRPALTAELAALRRTALLASPMLAQHPILFVVRRQYRRDHHNTATMFQNGEINTRSFQSTGALKFLDVRSGKVTTLLDLPQGVVRDPEVSFDGQRILFSMRKDSKDDYHLYEMNADGTGLRQLTFGSGVADIDPLYLPNEQIAFTSTREPKYCMCNRHIMGNLFRMDPDGANITQIGHSTLHEGHGALMPDGRILYDRWEYVDRNFGDAQGLWTCNPDGTNHQVYLMNHTRSPGAVLDARVIPGTERVIANFSSCHDRPWGAIALCDRRRGIDGKSPVLRTWPASAIDLVEKGNYDTFTRVKPKYEDPFPLVNPRTGTGGKYFLAARQVQGEQMGIVLLDVFGNELLLHTEAPGCYDPMPLGPSPRPVTIPDRIGLAAKEGTFYIYDVHIGLRMEKVQHGTVKHLRVVESPEKRFWTPAAWMGSGTQAPGMAWNDFNNKRILGTVPVEPDGSAYFRVPADRFVYFQLLDERGMMVQSMRSGTIARPGEVTGCVGCHESRLSGLPNADKLAIRRPPSPLEPWHGKPRLFNYRIEVQPVFDRHCIRCHDFGKPGAKKLVLAGDLTRAFNVSYMELRRKNLVNVPGAGPADLLAATSWGSHASRLVQVLRKGHNDVKLSPEEFDRIVTWIDINAPYYPDYASAYPNNQYGRSPLTGAQLKRLSKLTGENLGKQSHDPRITFTRPALSPCLQRIKDRTSPAYKEALAIIAAGKAALAARPRADMEGFQLVGIEAQRQAKYAQLAELEEQARKAVAKGEKAYPSRPPSP